jgi:hypothetical protein
MTEHDERSPIHRRLTQLESKPEPDHLDLEMLRRVYLAVGSDKAQPTFAQLATLVEETQRTAEFTIPGAYLYLGNLWRLAGDDARAHRHLLRSRDLLGPKARAGDPRKAPYLFTLLMLGDGDELLASGAEFGATACGEVGWAVVETVRAHRDGDDAELERLFADWDARVAAEPVDIDGRHPSRRDLRDLLREWCGVAPVPAGATPTAAPSMTASVDDVVDGDVLGWWGHHVVLARDDVVTLYDTTTRGVAYRVLATASNGLSWNPDGALFAAAKSAYALEYSASGLVATMLRPGGFCSIAGSLLAVESGFSASVYQADGTKLAVGRAPVALAPRGDGYAMATEEGLLRIVTLDRDAAGGGSVEIDLQCSTLAWFPDGTRIACGAEASQTVHTVAAASGDVLDSAALHDDDPIVGVAASPSGTMLASVGLDGVLGVRRFDPALSLSYFFDESLEQLAWDSTGELIAVRDQHGWFVATAGGQRLDAVPASSSAWHPSERSLAMSNAGNLTVLVY